MKKVLPVLLACLCFAISSYSQVSTVQTVKTEEGKVIRCLTTEKIAEARKNDPSIVARRAAIEERISKMELRNHTERYSRSGQPPVYTIPVVVHIVYRTNAMNISDQRVMEQIQVLNEDYRRTNSDAGNTPTDFQSVAADCEIEFCLATKDPNNNSTTGITRTQTTVSNIGQGSSYYSTASGGIDIWDPTKYLNIWVCELGGGILGYTYTPGNAPNGADGVVISYRYFGKTGASAPYNGGRTATHEVGHWLNLEHVWGPGNGGCNQDDFVNDTPIQNQASSGCPTHPSTSCSNNGDMFMNYMDYVNDNCMNMFTTGQKTRMRTAINASRPGLLTSQACVLASDDAAISEINAPAGLLCTTQITPQVTIKNHGGSPLMSAIINYKVDNGTTMTQNWSGNLATNQTDVVTLPSMTVAAGAHTFEAWTTLPNGNPDGDGSNDQSSGSFTIAAGGNALPFSEGFEGTTFPPTGWTANNPDSDVTWARTTDAAKTGSACMFMDNWDYPANGQPDFVTTPSLNMSGSASVTMTFELAYALYSATGFSDTLRVWGSDDCGQTWTQLYEKFGTALTTVSSLQTTEFVPGANDWRQETIDLSAYVNSADVQIRFEHVNDYENNLHIDDINITSTPATSINNVQAKSLLNVYPNPSTGLVNVDIKLAAESDVQIQVFNALGQAVTEINEAAVINGNYKINMADMAKGIYHIQVVGGGETMTRKVVLR